MSETERAELDEGVIARLRSGKDTHEDHVSLLRFWRAVADAYGDTGRVATLDLELETLPALAASGVVAKKAA